MVKLRINGEDHDVDVSADTPLLWTLRDVLGLTGTKFGCGIALCGACTVHVDGAALRSCILPVGALNGRAVTTIEGIGATPVGAPRRKGARSKTICPTMSASSHRQADSCVAEGPLLGGC